MMFPFAALVNHSHRKMLRYQHLERWWRKMESMEMWRMENFHVLKLKKRRKLGSGVKGQSIEQREQMIVG